MEALGVTVDPIEKKLLPRDLMALSAALVEGLIA
jgi:hypothetical protein